MLRVKVCVPQQRTDDWVRPHAACVAQAVRHVVPRDFTVGVFQVAEKVNGGVPYQYRDDPPKQKCVDATIWMRRNNSNKDGTTGHLGNGPALEVALCRSFERKCVETPTGAAVVNGDAQGREDDASSAALEGIDKVEQLAKVRPSRQGNVAKTGPFQLRARVVRCELRILLCWVIRRRIDITCC